MEKTFRFGVVAAGPGSGSGWIALARQMENFAPLVARLHGTNNMLTKPRCLPIARLHISLKSSKERSFHCWKDASASFIHWQFFRKRTNWPRNDVSLTLSGLYFILVVLINRTLSMKKHYQNRYL